MIASIKSVKTQGEVCEILLAHPAGELRILSLSQIEGNFTKVRLGVRASEVIISRALLSQCSLSNALKCEIKLIKKGELLSCIELEIIASKELLSCIISSSSATRLALKPGEQIYAYIKATSLYIKEAIK